MTQEAKFSFNCFLTHENGYEAQMTVRGDSLAEWRENFDAFAAELADLGYRRAERRSATAKPTAPAGEDVHEAHDIEWMEIAHTKAGKAYIKVGAGPFVKWGVSMYPEVIDQYEELNGWEAAWVPGEQYQAPEPFTQAVISKYQGKDGAERMKVIALR